MGIGRRIPDIGDHPVSSGSDREERQRAIRMPENVQLIRVQADTGKMNISKYPVARRVSPSNCIPRP